MNSKLLIKLGGDNGLQIVYYPFHDNTGDKFFNVSLYYKKRLIKEIKAFEEIREVDLQVLLQEFARQVDFQSIANKDIISFYTFIFKCACIVVDY